MSKWLDLEQFEGHTEGPWRIVENSNIGNLVEGPTGAEPRWHGDDGYRGVAMFQSCTAEQLAAKQDANARANGRLIAAAPSLLSENRRLREMLEEMAGALAGLIKACDAGRMVERGVGGMTTKAQLGRSYYNFVHAVPVEDARDALSRYTAMKEGR